MKYRLLEGIPLNPQIQYFAAFILEWNGMGCLLTSKTYVSKWTDKFLSTPVSQYPWRLRFEERFGRYVILGRLISQTSEGCTSGTQPSVPRDPFKASLFCFISCWSLFFTNFRYADRAGLIAKYNVLTESKVEGFVCYMYYYFSSWV